MSTRCVESTSPLPRTPSFAKKLRLVVREEEEGDNLFVRLSPAVAFDLYSLARRHFRHEFSAAHSREPGDAWTLFDEGSTNFVSFLPLCISSGDNVNILASYNGGTCGSSSDQDVIEVPRNILSVLSGVIPEFVYVHTLSRIDYGTQVFVEPASVEDWELLEIYSNSMEEGGLLGQISIIYPSQQLAIRINDSERVGIRVKEVRTRASTNTGNGVHSIWPGISSKEGDYGNEKNSSPQCVLLLQDTEMVVEPKARERKQNTPWLDPFRLIPSDADWGTSFEKFSKLTGRCSFPVHPGCVLVSTEQWPFESQFAQIKPKDSNQIRVVRVMTSCRIPQDNAVLFIGTRLDLHLSIHRSYICLKPLTSTRDEILERIVLEELYLDHDRGKFSHWNVPNIDLADPLREMNASVCNYQIGQMLVPVGAVIPLSSNLISGKESHPHYRWFRIASKSPNSGEVIRLNMKDILYSVKRDLKKSVELFGNLVVPEMSAIQRPQTNTLSSDWTKSIIDRMKKFSSICVTLNGVSGCGKTYNALHLSALSSFYFHRPIFYLDCKKLQKAKKRIRGILEEVDSIIARARKVGNFILVLDDLDSISPNLFGGDENDASERTHAVNPMAIDQSKIIGDRLSQLFKMVKLQDSNRVGSSLFLIATGSNADSINPSILTSSHVPLIHTKVPLLSADDRSNLLTVIIQRHSRRSRVDFDRSDISRRTEGYLPLDLEKLIVRALRSFRIYSDARSFHDHLVAEIASFTPITQTSNPKGQDQLITSWGDIGGLCEVKKVLESIVRQPLLYRRIYARARMQLPRGILLYGPSGCGKSYLVPALARECNYSIITCKGPEVLDKYIGASEAKVRELFERASQMAPSILFLDELEALAPRRGSDSTGVTDRVVNQLLTFLDGVEDVSSGTVFVIGATSRPDKVDPAIIRPGRLEKHLYIGPPTNSKDWSDLLTKVAKNWSLTAESMRSLSNEGDIVNMVIGTPRLCPADIRAALDTAHLNVVHRALNENSPGTDTKKIEIGVGDILFGLRETNPSLCESEASFLNSIYSSFKGNRSRLNDVPNVKTRELKTSLR